MKIKNLNKSPIKLLKLKLIKTKIYKKKTTLNYSKIESIEHKLKKAFQIIYKYHINKKKILFLSPSYNEKMESLLKSTNHRFLIQTNWLNGKVTNKNFGDKYNLIVLLNFNFNKNILEENYKAKIPLIVLEDTPKNSNILNSYTVSGDFSFNKKKIRDNFFLNLLQIILQKSKKKRSDLNTPYK